MKFDFKFIARRVILQAASFFPLVSNELDAVVFIEGGGLSYERDGDAHRHA